MDTEFLAQRLQCSRTDKQECYGVVKQLVELAFFAREHGLVELDKLIHQNKSRFPDPFLRRAISCLVDVSDHELLEKILTNYILTGNYIGHHFLHHMIVMEAVLAIHSRVDVDHIFSFLIPSLFGMDCERDIIMLYRDYTRQHGFNLSLPEEDDLPPATEELPPTV